MNTIDWLCRSHFRAGNPWWTRVPTTVSDCGDHRSANFAVLTRWHNRVLILAHAVVNCRLDHSRLLTVILKTNLVTILKSPHDVQLLV